jgi:hypothetical protein
VMCNPTSLFLKTVFAVGPVVPVVLHRIRWGQAVPPSGTGGTSVRRAGADRTNRNHGGPLGPTVRSHQKSAVLPAVPPVPPVPPGNWTFLSLG